MPDRLSIYQALPYPLRVVVASARGLILQSTRYGGETDHLKKEAGDRENWNSEQWADWESEKLAKTLHHAATNVPYYRNQWEVRIRKGDRASAEYIENWPVLKKEDLRAHGNAFLAEGQNIRQLVLDHTSGTSGVPLRIWMDRTSIRAWYALVEARWRGWYDLSRHDHWGMLGGQLVTAFNQSKPPFWVWNAGMHQLYLSTYHISPDNIPAYLDAIRLHKLVYLYGYASSLYEIAQLALEQNLNIPPIKTILSNAEPLFAYQRDTIARAFNANVHDTYGQAENVCAASECLQGRMHLWPEVGLTEILALDSDRSIPRGESGRLVCTGFLNHAMPLIRYEVGDLAVLAADNEVCACGRTLPIIKEIQGRMEDMILTRDGRRIEGPDTAFQADWPIREVQIIQETFDRIRVCIIPANGFNSKTADSIISTLRSRVGDMQIVIDEVSEIPRTKTGKRKVIVSLVNK
jgi:phenylacetate-CoA ligase